MLREKAVSYNGPPVVAHGGAEPQISATDHGQNRFHRIVAKADPHAL